MSKKQWLVLLMLFLTYLLLGASIFYHIESDLEVEKVSAARLERIAINGLLHEHYQEPDLNMILTKVSHYCGKSVFNYTEGEVDVYKWDFYNSFYFAYTVVSTIGYGNLAPTNMLGRILMIFYALIGIPMNGILLAQLGEFFGNVFVRAHKKYKDYKDGQADSAGRLRPLETRKAGLAAQIFMYLVPGFVMFIFFPSVLFTVFEGWQYDESVYYAFVTLSTIGFGDYVAGQDNTKGSGILWILYKSFLIIWISFGLGYLVMIMSFISQGMRSKRITRIEHKLAMNLKHTQSKIWNEFNKEVNWVRRIFYEAYMMKLKPVYRDECEDEISEEKPTRSQSFPDLRKLVYGGLESPELAQPRRRANSEVPAVMQFKPEAMGRVASENDLQRIDKNATFASHAMVQSAELLARLVLGYIPPPPGDEEVEEEDEDSPDPKGVDGFSDKDILAGEKGWAGSGWRIGDEKFSMPGHRARAASEIRLEKEENGFAAHQRNTEWTWSGPAASRKIQELIKARRSGASTPSKDAKSRIASFSQPSGPKSTRPRWFNPFSGKKNSRIPSRRESAPGDDLETNLRENYLSHTVNNRGETPLDRRQSAHYFTHTGGNLPTAPNGNLLEETSLADFLRALTTLHSTVGAVPEDFIPRPQRKMGTASLTPPKLPSLLALFAPLPGMQEPQIHSTQSTVTGNQTGARRFSHRPSYHSATSTPGTRRKGSNFVPPALGLRRFSLRPEETTVSSTSSYQRRSSLMPGAVPRRYSLKSVFSPTGTAPQTPPYTQDLLPLHVREQQDPPPYSADPFIFECPKEPLVSAEVGPAQDGITFPVRSKPVPRRFSLRPAQIGVPPAPASPKTPPTVRPAVPRWKGGMLQRQITELNLQRRVRALSLGDVHAVRNDRTTTQTSPLALPNAAASIKQNWPSEADASQNLGKTATTTSPAAINLAPKTIRDLKQTNASFGINESSTDGKNSNVVTLPQQLVKTDQGDFKTVERELRNLGDVNAAVTASPSPFSFTSDLAAGRQEPSTTIQPSSGPMLTAIRIDDHKMSVTPFVKDPSKSLELQSVFIDKPFSKPRLQSSVRDDALPPYSVSEKDSLLDVKVDSSSTGSSAISDREIKSFAGKDQSPAQELGIGPGGRKLSVISQRSVESAGAASSDGEKSLRRKISTLSEQGVELGSASGSRKSSTSAKSDKPRVSIESYKPLLELKIEKPATNPFEQYKATVHCKLEKPWERSKTVQDLRKESAETEERRKKSETFISLDSPGGSSGKSSKDSET